MKKNISHCQSESMSMSFFPSIEQSFSQHSCLLLVHVFRDIKIVVATNWSSPTTTSSLRPTWGEREGGGEGESEREREEGREREGNENKMKSYLPLKPRPPPLPRLKS